MPKLFVFLVISKCDYVVFMKRALLLILNFTIKLTEFYTVLGMKFSLATEALLNKLVLFSEERWAALYNRH